jgi:hypothetical protein
MVALPSREGLNWSNRLRDYLGRIDHEFVILMLEDFILRRRVDQTRVDEAVSFCAGRGLDCLRLVPRPPPQSRAGGMGGYGEIQPGEPYRVSSQAAIWRREFLLGLLRADESIWQFEINGTERAIPIRCKIWGVYHAVLPYEGLLAHHVVEKGKWIPHERWILAARGYPVGKRVRPLLGPIQLFCYHFGELFGRLACLFGSQRVTRWRLALRSKVPAWILSWYDSKRGVSAIRASIGKGEGKAKSNQPPDR